jgi:cytoskeleton protein RodZ
MGDTRRRKIHIVDDGHGTPDPAEPRLTGEPGTPRVSDLLRSRRLAMGYELRDVAVALRIRSAYLEAIEDGRFGDLPGATYATGFLRTYAEHLGLDPAMVLSRFKAETSDALAPKSELYLPKPVPEGRIPGGALLLLAVLLAGSAYGGWYYMNSTGRNLVDFVPPLPDRLAAAINVTPAAPPAPAPVAPVAPPEAPPPPVVAQAPEPQPVPPPIPAAPRPAPQAATAAPAPAPEEAEEEERPIVDSTPLNEQRPAQPSAPQQTAQSPSSAAAAPAVQGPPGQMAALPMPPVPPAAPEAEQGDSRVYGATKGQSRIQIRAVQDSWIQVRDGSGDLLMTRVLRPGDIYRVPDQPGLRMVTGNAGGLMVSVDGGPGTALGTPGQVMRDVQLDPQRIPGQAR